MPIEESRKRHSLKNALKHRSKVKQQRADGLTVYPTEEVLGDMTIVKEFAIFFTKHKEALETARASFLLDYCDGMAFTPPELKAYRLGIDALVKLFESAQSDMDLYLRNSEKRSVG